MSSNEMETIHIKKPIKTNYKKYYTQSDKNSVDEYVQSLNENQKKALEIAKEHLDTSFDILKSGGFIAWKTPKNK